MRVTGAVLTVVVVFFAALLQPMQAMAASSWTIKTSANELANQGGLNGVACPTGTTVCFAVGSHASTNPGSPLPLIEEWSGSAWATLPAPLPSGGLAGELLGVSCTSASACTAVGDYESSSTVAPLVERWNGSNWTVQSAPDPSGDAYSQLVGVYCSGASACIAVGTTYGGASISEGTLAESWNGSSWTIQTTPNRVGAINSLLASISCTASNACTAVGYDYNASNYEVTLAERWNGTTWTIQTTTNPTNSTDMMLSGVSCTSSSACIAVGSYHNSSYDTVALEERWNGTSWAIKSVPAPSGGSDPSLFSIACTSSSACVAVGSYMKSSGAQVTLAESWNGTNWTAQTMATLPSTDLSQALTGVSCSAAGSCTAVGGLNNASSEPVTLAEGWNSTSWTLQTTKNVSGLVGVTQLAGVSCFSSTACVAVGDYGSNSFYDNVYFPFAETWNGTGWTASAPVNPGGNNGATLSGVSCYSATGCMAVGGYTNSSSNQVGLSEVLNGTSWTTKTVPTPSGGSSLTLTSVSCTSSTACTAVGRYFNSSFTQVPVAERWNGTSWSAQTIPAPTGTDGYSTTLTGVACGGASACEAVGNYYTSGNVPTTFAEAWNGSSWSIQTTPNPTGGISIPMLNGVSCSAATTCAAVGSYYDNGYNQLPLALSLSGSTWSVKAAANPQTGYPSEFSSVSCPSGTTSCTAVGDYANSSGAQVTLAENWDGTSWSVKSTPNPTSGLVPELSGVSCTSTTCMAVGTYANAAGITVTLSELYQ